MNKKPQKIQQNRQLIEQQQFSQYSQTDKNKKQNYCSNNNNINNPKNKSSNHKYKSTKPSHNINNHIQPISFSDYLQDDYNFSQYQDQENINKNNNNKYVRQSNNSINSNKKYNYNLNNNNNQKIKSISVDNKDKNIKFISQNIKMISNLKKSTQLGVNNNIKINNTGRCNVSRQPYGIGLFGNDVMGYDYLTTLTTSYNPLIDKYSSLNLNLPLQSLDYQKYYKTGLNKYFKQQIKSPSTLLHHSNNNNPFKNKNKSFSNSQSDNKFLLNNSDDLYLQRSQFWNGQNYDYLNSTNLKHSLPNNTTLNVSTKPTNLRDSNSGLIVNKKQIISSSQSKQKQYMNYTMNLQKQQQKYYSKSNNKSYHYQVDTSKYIKIQQDLSSKKIIPNQYSNKKAIQKYPLRQQNSINKQNKQTTKQKHNPSSQTKTLIPPSDHSLLLKIKLLQSQNIKLLTIIKQKDIHIEKISKQRILDNQDYTNKINKLKILFEQEKQNLIKLKNHQNQVNFYKTSKIKQNINISLNQQLLKEQQKIISFNLQNKKLQQKIKQLTQKNIGLENQLKIKHDKVNKLNQQLKQQKIPKWINSFLRVFEDMIKKLPIQLDSSWNSKKVVIVGWRILKKIVEKAVKLGIKMPNIIANQEQQSLMMLPQKKTLKIQKLRN